MAKIKLTKLTVGDVLKLGRKFDPEKLSKLLGGRAAKGRKTTKTPGPPAKRD